MTRCRPGRRRDPATFGHATWTQRKSLAFGFRRNARPATIGSRRSKQAVSDRRPRKRPTHPRQSAAHLRSRRAGTALPKRLGLQARRQAAKLDFGGFRIFRTRDRQGPFIAARARTNEIFDFLVVHGVEIISSACLLGRPITSP